MFLPAYDAQVDLAAPVLTGIVNGCVYGLLALGLVLVYKSNRFFTFVHAEIGTVAALVAAHVRGESRSGFNYFLACSAGVGAAVVVALAIQLLVIRPLFHGSRITLTVATVGVALLLIQVELLIVGPKQLSFTSLVDPLKENQGVHALATTVSRVTYSDVIVVFAFIGAGLLATAFFRTRYGVGILAVSQEPTAASTVGISVLRISLLTWGVVGLLAGISGVTYGAKSALVPPGLLTFGTGSAGPLISAFVAAVLGGMTSLPGAFIGGLSVGLVEQFANRYQPDGVPGFQQLVVFGLLLLVLLVRPRGLLGKEA